VEHVWGCSFEVNYGKLAMFFIEELKELARAADRDLALGIEAEPEEPCDGYVVMPARRVSTHNILILTVNS